VWQALHEELGDRLAIITVALDASADDARPWIEAARPRHPALIDTRHVVADLYNMVNVPTAVWIDERGRLARPNDVAFGTDTFRHITGIAAARHVDLLRGWVRGEVAPLGAAEARARLTLPAETDQQARGVRARAVALHRGPAGGGRAALRAGGRAGAPRFHDPPRHHAHAGRRSHGPILPGHARGMDAGRTPLLSTPGGLSARPAPPEGRQ
jgi:hypothetical protein